MLPNPCLTLKQQFSDLKKSPEICIYNFKEAELNPVLHHWQAWGTGPPCAQDSCGTGAVTALLEHRTPGLGEASPGSSWLGFRYEIKIRAEEKPKFIA